MVSRYEKGSSSGQRYHYDSDHRIIAVDIDQGPLGYKRAEYRYDILGRRIEKRLWKASAIANTVTLMGQLGASDITQHIIVMLMVNSNLHNQQ
ncbi:hypothetical protein [Proteus mirabilis]|uniref:hypothetical protein n=1 Tax=Proteus mirabilis TaxID=584 RepID=UPI0021B10772|nr:hypothetical protein [Proteus mirabilis]